MLYTGSLVHTATLQRGGLGCHKSFKYGESSVLALSTFSVMVMGGTSTGVEAGLDRQLDSRHSSELIVRGQPGDNPQFVITCMYRP